MNETMNTILNRRSVRNFTREEIPEEILRDLVNAALHAPSGMCRKTWKFTVVTNQELIKKLTNAIKEVLSRESYDMYKPTAIIIPSNERDSVWGRDDNACALQNIFLAAKSYNVGSVWINQLNNICDETKIREILNELEIPENHIVYGLAALGYPDPNVEERPYREIGEVNFIK